MSPNLSPYYAASCTVVVVLRYSSFTEDTPISECLWALSVSPNHALALPQVGPDMLVSGYLHPLPDPRPPALFLGSSKEGECSNGPLLCSFLYALPLSLLYGHCNRVPIPTRYHSVAIPPMCVV